MRRGASASACARVRSSARAFVVRLCTLVGGDALLLGTFLRSLLPRLLPHFISSQLHIALLHSACIVLYPGSP